MKGAFVTQPSTPRHLISVGNVIVDVTVAVPVLPERGGDVIGRSHGAMPGGSFNTMVAARRQGLATSYAGAHGDGPYGELVRRALAESGIQLLHAPTVGIDTGFDIALTEPDGERSFITVFGAEAAITAESLATVRPTAHDFVHVSGYGLLVDTNGRVIADWFDSLAPGPVVLLDPGTLVGDIPSSILQSVLARTDWLSCNTREAQELTGMADATAAAHALLSRVPGVILRLGRDGCLVARGSTAAHGAFVTHIPGIDLAAMGLSVVDLNGAGDAHVGGFLAALARGESPERAAQFGNVTAGIAVTSRGPATAPTLAEAEAVLG